MRETINRDKVGTTVYEADVRYLIPLPDPSALGNRGLEGYDEDDEVRTFPTRTEAQEWALTWKPEAGEPDYLQVNEVTWDADDFDDEVYGTILDATATTTQSWFWDHAAKTWEVLV